MHGWRRRRLSARARGIAAVGTEKTYARLVRTPSAAAPTDAVRRGAHITMMRRGALLALLALASLSPLLAAVSSSPPLLSFLSAPPSSRSAHRPPLVALAAAL